MAIEDFEFHSGAHEAAVRLLLPRQPFVPQAFHDGIGNQRQPPIQFTDHVGGSDRRGETKYGAAQIEAPQASQAVVLTFIQRPVEPGGRSDIDVRLAVSQGLHGLCDGIQLDQPHARIRLWHRLHPRTSGNHDGRGAVEKIRVEGTLIALPGHDQCAAFQIAGGIHQAVRIFGQRNGAEHQVRFAAARGTHRLVPTRISAQFDNGPRPGQQFGEELTTEAGQLAVLYVFKGIAILEDGNGNTFWQAAGRGFLRSQADLNLCKQQERGTEQSDCPPGMLSAFPTRARVHQPPREWRFPGP
ncbi:hypothetical protein D3C78_447720 [compost metagenome]